MRRLAALLVGLIGMLALVGAPSANAAQVPDAAFVVPFPTSGSVIPAPVKTRLRTFIVRQPLGTTFTIQGTVQRDGAGRTDASLVALRTTLTKQYLVGLGAANVRVIPAGPARLLKASDLTARQVRVSAFRPRVPPMPTFVVNFDANGGALAHAVETFTVGGPALLLPTPEPARGYAFVGWYSTAAGGTFYGLAGASFSPFSDTVMYAHWRHMTTTLHLTITDTDPYMPRAGYVTGCLESCTVTVVPRIGNYNNVPGPVFDKTLLVEIGSTITIELPDDYNFPLDSGGATCRQTRIGAIGIPSLFTCTAFLEGVPAYFVIDHVIR